MTPFNATKNEVFYSKLFKFTRKIRKGKNFASILLKNGTIKYQKIKHFGYLMGGQNLPIKYFLSILFKNFDFNIILMVFYSINFKNL